MFAILKVRVISFCFVLLILNSWNFWFLKRIWEKCSVVTNILKDFQEKQLKFLIQIYFLRIRMKYVDTFASIFTECILVFLSFDFKSSSNSYIKVELNEIDAMPKNVSSAKHAVTMWNFYVCFIISFKFHKVIYDFQNLNHHFTYDMQSNLCYCIQYKVYN